jgi:transposase
MSHPLLEAASATETEHGHVGRRPTLDSHGREARSVCRRRFARGIAQPLSALIAGERDPERLADLALGRLRSKNAALIDALTGRFNEHHAFLCQLLLDQIDHLDAAIARLDQRIDAAIEPFRGQLQRLTTIPGSPGARPK